MAAAGKCHIEGHTLHMAPNPSVVATRRPLASHSGGYTYPAASGAYRAAPAGYAGAHWAQHALTGEAARRVRVGTVPDTPRSPTLSRQTATLRSSRLTSSQQPVRWVLYLNLPFASNLCGLSHTQAVFGGLLKVRTEFAACFRGLTICERLAGD